MQPIAVALAMIIAAAAHAADPFPTTGFPAAAGIQFKGGDWTIEQIDKAYEAGFRVIRKGFYWNAIEKEVGVYDFSGWDAQMDHARTKGIRIIGCFFSNNKLHENDQDGGIQTEAGRQGFAAWAAACATHYADHDVIWEIWNEPNVRTFWRKSGKHNSKEFAAEYSALVNAVTPAMLAANPDAVVLAGSVSNYWQPSYEWTEFCFQNGVLDSGISAWSVHPYGVKRPEDFATGHRITRELLAKYGKPDLPMVNTERGFAIKEHREGWSGGDKAGVYDYQAWNLVRQYMVDQLHGIKHTVWYEWQDDGFGLWDEQGKTRPAYDAAVQLFAELDGFHLDARLPSSFELDYVLRFVDGAGAAKLVAWTAPPPGGSPDELRPHPLTLPVTAGGGSAVIDGGDPIAIGDALVLQLSGKPIFVGLPAAVTLGPGEAEVAPIVAVDANQNLPESAVDLELFDQDAEWRFDAHGHKGSFTLNSGEHGGQPLGVIAYDFSAHDGKGRPYVFATTALDVTAGKALRIHARSDIRQQLTIRLTDGSGQTLQHKAQLTGTGKFEAITIDFGRKLEHWGGKNDGKVHFPLTKLLLSVPLPNDEHKVGSVDYADIVVIE